MGIATTIAAVTRLIRGHRRPARSDRSMSISIEFIEERVLLSLSRLIDRDVAQNATGRLQAFVLSSPLSVPPSQVYSSTQITPGGPWSGWSSLEG